MSIRNHRWRSKWAALLVAGTLLVSAISPALPAARAEEGAAPGAAALYSDLSSSYAAKEIASLSAAGILDGFDDGTFRPADPVTRAQFAKIIAGVLKLKAEPDIALRFKDVPSDAWYAGYTGALVKEGITDGVSENEFAPDHYVTREELAAFFMRALKLSKSAEELPVEPSIFADFNEISAWARHYVSFAYKIGLLQGSQDESGKLLYLPKAQADRQAVARLAYELLNHTDTYLEKASSLTAPSASPSPSASAAAFGGGGGGGGGGGVAPTPSPAPTPADGSTLADLPAGTYTGSFSVAAGSTVFGPQTGTAVITGTLTVDPGASGEVTLRNIQAADLRVLSGSDHSVILQGVKVSGTLTVNTGSQAAPVRVLSQSGTAITRTLLESAAILEIPAGSAGDVTIGSAAAGKTVELRGSFPGTVLSQAPETSIVIRNNASLHALVIEASGRLQADGTIGSFHILNPDVRVELSGTNIAALKENAGKAMEAAVQNLGDSAQLTLGDLEKVLEVMKQYYALQALNAADSLPAQAKEQLQAAQNRIKTLVKGAAEEKLKALPSITKIDWSQRVQMEKNMVAAQLAVDIAKAWGCSETELEGYGNWASLKSVLDQSYLFVASGDLEGDLAVAGTTQPGVEVSLGKIKSSTDFTILHVGKVKSDSSGHFLFFDYPVFPLKTGDRLVLDIHNPETGYTIHRVVEVSTPSSATNAPLLKQPYYEGDPLVLDYGSSTYGTQLVLVLNSKGQLLFGGLVGIYQNGVVYPDGPIKAVPDETLTVYSRSASNSRGISEPLQFKVLSNSGDSRQPVAADLYDGDFIVRINAAPGALVTLEGGAQTLRQAADANGLAVFRIPQTRLEQGSQIKVIAKETGKQPSTPVFKQVQATTGKSEKPDAVLIQSDQYVTISGTFPGSTSLLLQWGESSSSPTMVFQLGTSPDSPVYFSENISTGFIYNKTLYIYAKTPGKGLSDPQELTLIPKTRLSAVGGTIYTDSVNVKVTADPGSLVTIKRPDGTVIYQKQGSADSNVILLDSMRLKTNLTSGEIVFLTATAPGKQPSASHALKAVANQGKTGKPVVAGTLTKGMSEPVLSILSASYKFGVRIETPDGTESSWFEPKTGFGGLFGLHPLLVDDGSKLLVFIKEHGKERSDAVEVPVYDATQVTSLQTVSQTVYQSTNPAEAIKGLTDPFAAVTLRTAEGQIIASGSAGILGSFELKVPHSSLVPETLLSLTAQAQGLPESRTVTLAVYAAQGETPKPVASEAISSGGTMIQLDLQASAGSYVTIYNQEGALLDSGYWKGNPGEQMEISTIFFNVKQLNQTLKIAAQLPGRNRSEFVEVSVQEDRMASFTSYPVISGTQYDYPGGLTKIAGSTEPFTLIKGGVTDTYSDVNGNFELYVPTTAGSPHAIQFQAPGKQPVLYFVVMLPETLYTYGEGSSGGGIIIGGGGGGAPVQPVQPVQP